jgi:hypothetical protein
MDPRSLIASRIDLQLRRHLGQPLDTYRALHDARYAKDMLLVCEAMAGTDLPQLAHQFREADEHITAARRALAPRSGMRTRAPMPYMPPASLDPAQRPMTFGGNR